MADKVTIYDRTILLANPYCWFLRINDFSLARRPISVGSSSSSSLNEESGSGVVDLTVDLTVDSDVEELAVVDLTSPSPKKPLSRDGSDNKEKSDSRSFTTSATDDDVIIISSPCLPLGSSSVPHSVSPSSSTSDRYSSISCPVCMETQTAFSTSSRFLVATNCGHLFCNECLRKSIALMHKCPTCSRKLSLKQYHRIYL